MRRRVLLVLSWYDPGRHRGVARYAGEHGWHLNARSARHGGFPARWEGDGIIACIRGREPRLNRLIAASDASLVEIGNVRPTFDGLCVSEHNEEMGRLAAEHFLSKGFRRFFCLRSKAIGSRVRWRSFVATVREQGFSCTTIRSRQYDLLTRDVIVSDEMSAVFCPGDGEDLAVLEAALDAGLAVPEQLAILGVSNLAMTCEYAEVPLSNVDANQEMIGYTAASILDQLMNGEDVQQKPVLIPPKGVVTRRSTDIVAVPHPELSRALQFIKEHYTDSIGVDDVVDEIGLSRRGLYKVFQKHLGRSPGSEIQRLRMAHARRLLAGADLKVQEVAAQSGFGASRNLCVAFRRELNMAPLAYRRSIRERGR